MYFLQTLLCKAPDIAFKAFLAFPGNQTHDLGVASSMKMFVLQADAFLMGWNNNSKFIAVLSMYSNTKNGIEKNV